jgi:hypothetical protein
MAMEICVYTDAAMPRRNTANPRDAESETIGQRLADRGAAPALPNAGSPGPSRRAPRPLFHYHGS